MEESKSYLDRTRSILNKIMENKYILLLVPFILSSMRFITYQIDCYIHAGSWNLLYLQKQIVIESTANVLIETIIVLFILKFINIKTRKDFFTSLTFILYICFLYKLTIYNMAISTMVSKNAINTFKINTDIVDLIPFKNIAVAFNARVFFIQVFGNLVMLSPLAFFISYYNTDIKLKKLILWIFIITCAIESYQLLQGSILSMYDHKTTLKVFDIDDIMLNTAGGFIGIFIYRIYLKFKYNYQNKLIYKYAYRFYIVSILICSYHYFTKLYFWI